MFRVVPFSDGEKSIKASVTSRGSVSISSFLKVLTLALLNKLQCHAHV